MCMEKNTGVYCIKWGNFIWTGIRGNHTGEGVKKIPLVKPDEPPYTET